MGGHTGLDKHPHDGGAGGDGGRGAALQVYTYHVRHSQAGW